jgi:hypothetical protein
VDVDHADVGHAAVAAPLDHQIARAEGVVGAGQERVAPPLHRRGAGVIGLAVKDHAAAANPHDGIDHGDGDAGLFQARALLDVQLDVGVHGSLGCARLGGAGGIEAGARHGVDQLVAVHRRHGRNGGGVEATAEGPRAEETAVASLLVTPRRDHQRPSWRRARLADRVEALEAGQHAERAVQRAALRHRVDVRASDDERRRRIEGGGPETTEDVTGRVDPPLEPGRANLPEQPCARLLVRRTPARAGDPAARQRAEARKRSEATHQTRCVHGGHGPGV